MVSEEGGRDLTLRVTRLGSDEWRCEYTPLRPVPLSVSVSWGSQSGRVSGSPWRVGVAPKVDLEGIKAWGRGLQSRGVRVGDNVDFFVNSSAAGPGSPVVHIQGPRKPFLSVFLFVRVHSERKHSSKLRPC